MNKILCKTSIVLLILIFAAGCKNPFSTRESEPPIGTSGTWEVPTEPRIVVANLLAAYNERNISNYRRCLSDSFAFSAYEDSVEAEQNGDGSLFYDWDVNVEESVTRRIFQSFPQGSDSSYLSLMIDLSSNEFDEEDDSTAMLIREYTLSFVTNGESTVDTTIAVGEAMFYMSRSSIEGWAIDLWIDRPDPRESGSISWADFKVQFR
ncbi:MAG: hypothetical protein GF307_07015 [candidate division Zixibacteria bacterium]|nr:hypothetical protein [candidate division Zixibacteria bacterium]